jgi:hypothetical protein
MACCGDVPTLETLAAVSILREHLPELKVRVVNVVDLMKLQPQSEHPHGLSDEAFDALFTRDRPVIFAFHATTCGARCTWVPSPLETARRLVPPSGPATPLRETRAHHPQTVGGAFGYAGGASGPATGTRARRWRRSSWRHHGTGWTSAGSARALATGRLGSVMRRRRSWYDRVRREDVYRTVRRALAAVRLSKIKGRARRRKERMAMLVSVASFEVLGLTRGGEPLLVEKPYIDS